jgi:hypothetical protein
MHCHCYLPGVFTCMKENKPLTASNIQITE